MLRNKVLFLYNYYAVVTINTIYYYSNCTLQVIQHLQPHFGVVHFSSSDTYLSPFQLDIYYI